MRLSDGQRVGTFVAAFFASAAILSAYLPLWFADRGLSPVAIGQILGIATLLRVVAVPGWGRLADAWGRRRLLLIASAMIAAVLAASLPAADGFWPVLLIAAGHGIAASALTPLADALTLALAAQGRLDYGRTRAYGSVAYMAAAALAGGLLGRTGSWVVPWMLAAGYGAAAGAGLFLPQAAVPLSSAPVHSSVLRLPALRLTLTASALIQGAHGAYYAFAPLYWRAAGIPDFTIGLLIAEGIVAEVALFVWGRRLIERLGPARLTALAAGASVLRWAAMAFVTDVPWLCLLQVLHAGTFAFQHLSSMLVLSRVVPPGRAASAQTMLSAFGYSGPMGAMIWLSGRIYADAGGLTFLVMAVVGGSAGLLVPALHRAIRWRHAADRALV